MVRWIVGSIPHGGPIELVLVLARAPRLWDGTYKRTLADNQKE